MLTPKKTISATDAARNLSDLLNRVQYRGEQFIIVRNGAQIAEVSPPPDSGTTLGELVRQLSELPPVDEKFREDLSEIRASQPPVPESRWDS